MIGRTNALTLAGQVLAKSNFIQGGSATVREITYDGTNVYFLSGTSGQNRLTKMNPTTMETTSVITDNYSGIDIFTSGDYVYIANTYKAYKYLKSDLSLVSSTAQYTSSLYGMVTDGTYLYISGAGTKTIRKYALTDLTTLVAESSATTYNISAMAYDSNFIYIRAGSAGSVIYKYDTATLTLQATSVTIHYTGIAAKTKMIVKGDYVLSNSYDSLLAPYPYLERLDKATLQTYDFIDVSSSVANIKPIMNIHSNGSFIYLVGSPTSQDDVVYAVKVSDDLTTVTNLLLTEKIYVYGGAIYIDTNYIYFGGYPTDSVLKIARE